MAKLKVLALAVASGRVGYVFLDGTQLRDWAITTRVSGNTSDLVAFVQELINTLNPDVVVTERCDHGCRKGKRTRQLIGAIAELASHNYVLDITLPKPRDHSSKYEEAKELVARHPDLVGYLPKRKRRIYERENRNMLIFEALALAEEVNNGPPEALAAAMG